MQHWAQSATSSVHLFLITHGTYTEWQNSSYDSEALDLHLKIIQSIDLEGLIKTIPERLLFCSGSFSIRISWELSVIPDAAGNSVNEVNLTVVLFHLMFFVTKLCKAKHIILVYCGLRGVQYEDNGVKKPLYCSIFHNFSTMLYKLLEISSSDWHYFIFIRSD